MFRLTRMRKTGGKVEADVVMGSTSLPGEWTDHTDLLGLNRNHWCVGNGPRGVRDGTRWQDASGIQFGAAKETLAIVRNLVMPWFKWLEHKSKAAAARRDVCHPGKSVEVLSVPISE